MEKDRNWTDQNLIDAAKISFGYLELMDNLGYRNYGQNYKTVRKYIQELNIDLSHFLSGSEQAEISKKENSLLTKDQIFCENELGNNFIKRYIIKNKIIEYKCKACSINSWNGKELSLHLEHIDGNNKNNTLDNICWLCPLCHSQTDTFCVRKTKPPVKILPKKFCLDCNLLIRNKSTRCRRCTGINNITSKNNKSNKKR